MKDTKDIESWIKKDAEARWAGWLNTSVYESFISGIEFCTKTFISEIKERDERIKELEELLRKNNHPDKQINYWKSVAKSAQKIIEISGVVSCEGYEEWRALIKNPVI